MEIKPKTKPKKRSKKKKRELLYSLVFLVLIVAGILYFYQVALQKNSANRKPFTPSIKPITIQNTVQNPAQAFFATNNHSNPSPDIFATNGKNTAYKIKEGNKWSVLFNGATSKAYDYVSNPVFSPDGTQFAFNAELGNQAFVVVNSTQIINAYQKANDIVFSQNNQTIAFLAAKNDTTYVVVTSPVTNPSTPAAPTQKITQSQPIAQPGTVTTASGSTASIIVSPDGNQVAYVVQNGSQTQVVVNGQTSTTYDNISNFTLNNDGTCSYQAQSDGQVITVVDNKIISTSSSTSTPSTSTTSATSISSSSTSSSTQTAPTNSSGSTTTSSGSSTSGTSTKPSAPEYYQYQYTSGQDINMSPNRLDYTDCPSGNCGP